MYDYTDDDTLDIKGERQLILEDMNILFLRGSLARAFLTK